MMVASTMVIMPSFSPGPAEPEPTANGEQLLAQAVVLELAAKRFSSVVLSGTHSRPGRYLRSGTARCSSSASSHASSARLNQLLHEVHMRGIRHQSTGGARCPAGGGAARSSHSASHGDLVHRGQEHVALGGRRYRSDRHLLVGRHGQGLFFIRLQRQEHAAWWRVQRCPGVPGSRKPPSPQRYRPAMRSPEVGRGPPSMGADSARSRNPTAAWLRRSRTRASPLRSRPDSGARQPREAAIETLSRRCRRRATFPAAPATLPVSVAASSAILGTAARSDHNSAQRRAQTALAGSGVVFGVRTGFASVALAETRPLTTSLAREPAGVTHRLSAKPTSSRVSPLRCSTSATHHPAIYIRLTSRSTCTARRRANGA